ncbi:MAG: CsbD family protein [Bradyrhizobium sp.]|uniref:CsbD family protein n=1 Tax=Bradyrhizobium sp. TaxID=376 RepID=UPI001C28E653|nr:CsbD family protein [Bradyrhizobium sp.]MBU6464312.1 CsbD family protein [Pseudomonadota bacterium]MDE2069059.1 CsbD family protein [Bradyrhizobium sp.]MDE2241489.1 CsbD family protein [Bradyrhizobium sp.]MDE2471454.1 CsbD family protein [Bradyrhizobium sp.]
MDKDRIAGSAKDFAGRVEDAVGDAAEDAKTRASGRMREATGAVQNLYGQAKDAARNVGDAARDAYENSGDTLRDGSQAVARKVQDNPLGSLLVAGGIGFALALLMTRPPRRPPPRWRYYG